MFEGQGPVGCKFEEGVLYVDCDPDEDGWVMITRSDLIHLNWLFENKNEEESG